MAITCCYKCPDRWFDGEKTCHSTCERYAKEKEIHDALREKEKRERVPLIKESDFNMVTSIHVHRKHR